MSSMKEAENIIAEQVVKIMSPSIFSTNQELERAKQLIEAILLMRKHAEAS